MCDQGNICFDLGEKTHWGNAHLLQTGTNRFRILFQDTSANEFRYLTIELPAIGKGTYSVRPPGTSNATTFTYFIQTGEVTQTIKSVDGTLWIQEEGTNGISGKFNMNVTSNQQTSVQLENGIFKNINYIQ